MIASLRGKPVARTPEGLVLDVGGVGYLVHATPRARARADGPAEVTLPTYLAVREDALQLYGFADADERELFVHLLAVNGIGPKVALTIVSGSRPADLRKAILLEDTKRFEAIPGIGKKTAQRVVLELKEKLGGASEVAAPGSPDLVAQERIKEQLAVALEATRARGEALDHVLLVGPPGLGKTSLAFIVREELGAGIRTVAGPALERKGDLAAILTSLEARDVLFVDEIHRLNAAVEEILYPALEDFRLDIVVGQGPAARTLTLDLPPFTLVGATTRTGLLTTPLRDRFGMTFRLGYYR